MSLAYGPQRGIASQIRNLFRTDVRPTLPQRDHVWDKCISQPDAVGGSCYGSWTRGSVAASRGHGNGDCTGIYNTSLSLSQHCRKQNRQLNHKVAIQETFLNPFVLSDSCQLNMMKSWSANGAR